MRAIEVHRHLGPGLLESAYEECLCYELAQVPLPVVYKSVRLDCGYRLDVVVENQVIVELEQIPVMLDPLFIVIPGLVPGIHVDGRDKPGHDEKGAIQVGRNPL